MQEKVQQSSKKSSIIIITALICDQSKPVTVPQRHISCFRLTKCFAIQPVPKLGTFEGLNLHSCADFESENIDFKVLEALPAISSERLCSTKNLRTKSLIYI